MTDDIKTNFMLAVRSSLEHVFEPKELAEDITLEANIGPRASCFHTCVR